MFDWFLVLTNQRSLVSHLTEGSKREKKLFLSMQVGILYFDEDRVQKIIKSRDDSACPMNSQLSSCRLVIRLGA